MTGRIGTSGFSSSLTSRECQSQHRHTGAQSSAIRLCSHDRALGPVVATVLLSVRSSTQRQWPNSPALPRRRAQRHARGDDPLVTPAVVQIFTTSYSPGDGVVPQHRRPRHHAARVGIGRHRRSRGLHRHQCARRARRAPVARRDSSRRRAGVRSWRREAARVSGHDRRDRPGDRSRRDQDRRAQAAGARLRRLRRAQRRAARAGVRQPARACTTPSRSAS